MPILVWALAVTAGCATVIKGTGRDVEFTSNPRGAAIYVQGKYVGKTPVIAHVSHGRDKLIEARLAGYLPKQRTLTTSFSGHSLWLFYFSLIVDAISGSIFTVDDGSMHFELEAISAYIQASAASLPQQPAPSRFAPTPQPASVFATTQPGSKRLAVLEFQGSKGLEEDVLMALSDEVRGGALAGLRGRGVSVMTRENMLVLLKDMGKQECQEGDCEVETARNIGADYVVSGKVVIIERTYVVTLKLHETRGGSLLGSVTVEAKSQVELMRSLRERTRQLMLDPTGAHTGP